MGFVIFISIFCSIPLIIIPFVKAIRRNINFWKIDAAISTPTAQLDFGDDILDVPLTTTATLKQHIPYLINRDFAELLFMGISPILGIFLVGAFKSEILPFEIKQQLTLVVFILVPYLTYWLSRYYKANFSPLANVFFSYGMLLGLLLYTALFLHFLAPIVLLAGVVFSFLAFPLFAPLPAFLYSLRELRLQQLHLATYTKDANPWWSFLILSWRNSIINLIFMLLLITIIIYVLSFWGQPFYAILSAFLNSKEFFFSSPNTVFFFNS
ncbi:MAG: DUF6688 family protein [Saprospiraceae bacterium]